MKLEAYTLHGTDHVTTTNTLLKWMGALWSAFSDDPEFVKRYQQAKALINAQLTVLYQETAALSDRDAAPVYHRERWAPITLKESERNTGLASSVRLGGPHVPVIGPQLESPFIAGTKIRIGGNYPLQGVAAYPLPDDYVDIASVIVNNPADPTTVLMRGVDFYVRDNTVFFLHGTDPLLNDAFTRVTLDTGVQTLMWAGDALVDSKYIYDFFGYVLDIPDESSHYYKRYLNALWTLFNAGATLSDFQAGIAAILDEPCILEQIETVTLIERGKRDTKVVTDKHVYTVNNTAELREGVSVGSVLHYGDLITRTVKLYNDVDPLKLTAESEYGDVVREDIPAYLIPKDFFRSRLSYGIGVDWTPVAVTAEEVDRNGNPKLHFKLHGDAEDVRTFWKDFWDYCEAYNVPSSYWFTGLKHPTGVFGYYGTVTSFEFFLSNFLKNNTMFITVDSSKLSGQGRKGMGNLSLLTAVIPEHTYVTVLERVRVKSDICVAPVTVELPVNATIHKDTARPGGRVTVRLNYSDRASTRWIPFCIKE